MDLGVVILPTRRWDSARVQWETLDGSGVTTGYTYDHLSWRVPFRDGPWFSMIPTLTAAASVTRRLRVGPLVTSPNFRHPLVLAKDLLALDDVSGGRLVVGVGSGGTGFDATTLSREPWSARERHARFEEFTRALDQLLREPASTLEGEYYPVHDSRQLPGPRQQPRPPLVLSALGPKSLALTAELADGWVSYGAPAGDERSLDVVLAEQNHRLDEELASRGRSATSLRRVMLNFTDAATTTDSLEGFLAVAGRMRDLGFDEVVIHWPVADSPFDYPLEVFESIAHEGAATLAGWP